MLLAGTPAVADAALSPSVGACRATVGRSVVKLTKAMLRAIGECHGDRDRSPAMTDVDCNDLATADADLAVEAAERKFLAAVGSSSGPCAGVAPSEALYFDCPSPCDLPVGPLSSFADVAACVACSARAGIEELAMSVRGAPVPPLPAADLRCESTIGKSSARLFQLAVRDVVRCQAVEEKAGATTAAFCTESAYPRPVVEDGRFAAADAIVAACGLDSFANLDTCAQSTFEVAGCVSDETLAGARRVVSTALSMPATTTTTTTTSTTLPPVLGDPQCPAFGELVLYSRDTKTPCASNDDCAPPRTCNTLAGICASLSELDSGWTGNAHDSDIDDGIVTRSRLVCPGPAPVCGECQVDGVDPSAGSCRCANDARTACDRPFAADSDDCGGATCNCYFGVPVPLSSAGTPACLVNRYSEDLTGSVDVDTGASEIRAKLRTRIYLGIDTTRPCPVCGGTCSHDASVACVTDADCGSGNSCRQDPPNDGIREGLCIEGEQAGLPCDVGGVNPSFPAVAGALPGGGGYSLDCLPTTGSNISGEGLALDVTQTTGTSTLPATLPCTGGNCFCKTCSADPAMACSADSDCTGASCAVSPNFACASNADCSSLDLGNCLGIHRCSRATSVSCTTNTDCKNYSSGGPCKPSSCTALGSRGVAPSPNACSDGLCNDLGDGEGACATGPDDRTCDGLVRADGRGILSCANNTDCTTNSPLNGTCSLVERRACFLDPIVATGSADPDFPVGVATFCVPPTSNNSINLVAGLPGPTRLRNQGRSQAFCAGDPQVPYQAGAGGCP